MDGEKVRMADVCRSGMCQFGSGSGLLWEWHCGWQQLVWLCLALALTVGELSGCQRTASFSYGPATSTGLGNSDPRVIYESVYGDYLHGSLNTAEFRARQSFEKFSKEAPA